MRCPSFLYYHSQKGTGAHVHSYVHAHVHSGKEVLREAQVNFHKYSSLASLSKAVLTCLSDKDEYEQDGDFFSGCYSLNSRIPECLDNSHRMQVTGDFAEFPCKNILLMNTRSSNTTELIFVEVKCISAQWLLGSQRQHHIRHHVIQGRFCILGDDSLYSQSSVSEMILQHSLQQITPKLFAG